MHSSGMHTACLLTVSQHALGRGCVCIQHALGMGGVCVSKHALGRGVSQHALGRGVYIPACTGQGMSARGCPPGGVSPGVSAKGVSAQEGVCLGASVWESAQGVFAWGCLPRGGVCLGSLPLVTGGCIAACNGADTSLWTERHL